MSETRKPMLFGDPTPDIQRKAEADATRRSEFATDPFYIPGYSELVKANAIGSAVQTFSGQGIDESEKQDYYKRYGTSPRELPFHFMPVRVRGPGGGGSTQADIEADTWKNLGYRPVSAEDFEEGGKLAQAGFGKPTAMTETADGKFTSWDTELWVVDGERHRINEAQKQAEADWQEGLTMDPEIPDALASEPTREDAGQRPLQYDPNA